MASETAPSQVSTDSCAVAHVLVIDDSLVCRTQVKNCLTKSGLRVTELTDGIDAYETAKAIMPDVVVTDVQMPKMDGFEVCRMLKRDQSTQHIPVIFITSDESTAGILQGFDAGGTDYIRKGAAEAEIVARVNTHVKIATLQSELLEKNGTLEDQIALEKDLRTKLHDQQLQLLHTEKLASIGHLAAGVAHEINNPIGFVGSNLNTLDEYIGDIVGVLNHLAMVDGSTSDSTIHALRHAVAQLDLEFMKNDLVSLISESIDGISRVSRIVSDLKDFTHVEAPEAGITNLNDLIERSISIKSNDLPSGVTITRTFGELQEIPCFSGKVAQVALNLIANAVDSVSDNGIIHIRTGEQDGFVWFEVEDNGCGIQADELPRIFDPFYTTKDVGNGTGLGLHFAQTVVANHGGSIRVCSDVGSGSVFRVELPVSGPPVNTEPSSASHELS